MISENMASCIGNTPLVRLSKVFPDSNVTVLAKLELMNPGGSIKDRPAKFMLEAGIQAGTIKPDSHIIESSSGNLAIALAMICKMKNLNFTAVVDPKISPTNLKILKLFGANTVVVSEKDENDGYLLTRINTVKQLLKSIKNAVWINQYANPDNWRSHYFGEASEVLNQIDQKIDYLVIGASTSGTLMGVSRRLKEEFPDMKVIAVDIVGSVLFGGKSAPREIPGIGASRVPELLSINEVDQVVYVDDFESALGCRRLIAEEGIFAGGSSGSAISAIEKMLPDIPAGKCVFTLLPDRGDRYLDLVYDESWLEMVRERHFNKSANLQQPNLIES